MSSWFASFSGLHARSPLPLAVGHIKRTQTSVIRFSELKCTFFFHPATDPFPPERPQNITAENQTVSADGRVSVLLRWDPPREGDLQLRHYKVTWSGPSGKESGRVADGVRLPLCSSYHILFRSQMLVWVWLQTPNIFFCPTFTASPQEVFFFFLHWIYLLLVENAFWRNSKGERSCQSPMRSCEVL